MAGKQRVTIGIPFYNAEGTLGDAIRSIFAQSFTNWELILVDDGSTDRSVQIARSVRDPRVRVISDGVNRGLVHRLNQLVALARGEMFARMDADDMMDPRRIERQVSYMDAHPDADLVGSAVCTIDAADEPVGKRALAGPGTDAAEVLRGRTFLHPTVTGRTAWFRANPYDDRYPRAEDHELWCRTCGHTRFAHIPELLLFYRELVPINLGSYLKSCRTEREIIRRYGPGAVGWRETWRLLLVYRAKPTIARIARALGLDAHLVNRRNAPLLPEERMAVCDTIARIRKTLVPGLAVPRSPAPG